MRNLLLGGLIILGTLPSFAMEITESLDQKTGDLSALITNPAHLPSGLPFSRSDLKQEDYPSSEDGVCKVLGYERAAKGSSRGLEYRVDALQVDMNGRVTRGPSTWPLTRIVCLNKTNITINEKSYLLSKPVHLESRLPFSRTDLREEHGPSSEDGICRVLGYQKAAKGSGRGLTERVDTIQVDSSGRVIGGPNMWPLTQIVCLTEKP